MPYTERSGVRIYFETEGAGPPLVIHHGLTGSLETMRDWGYVQGLRDDYTCILIDARGHGKSGKPHETGAYTTAARSADVIAVLDELGVERAHFFGYSMGGAAGYCCAMHSPERFLSFALGGMSPRKREGAPAEDRAAAMRSGGMAATIAAQEAAGRVYTPEQRARYMANDIEAIIAVSRAFAEAPDMRGAMRALTQPALLFAGTADAPHDAMRDLAPELRDGRFFSLPGLEHTPAIMATGQVLPRLREFLASVPALA